MPDISICIPTYNKPRKLLARALESALADAPASAEVLIAPDGPEAHRAALALPRAAQVQILPSDVRLGLVGNWNRCLEQASNPLIHLLHDDDAVVAGFYEAVLAMFRGWPSAGLFVTSSQTSLGAVSASKETSPLELRGPAAATFLLESERFVCGSVVLNRDAVASLGPFSDAYPYCPDEEAYQRYAAELGLVFDARGLYTPHSHPDQARNSTWRQENFARVYLSARADGAACFGPAVAPLAEESSGRRLLSVAVTLALSGERRAAVAVAEELVRFYPDWGRRLRYRITRAALGSRTALLVLHTRRLLRRNRFVWATGGSSVLT